MPINQAHCRTVIGRDRPNVSRVTEAALPALRAAATGIGDGMVAREAEETLKMIRERES
jgi:hypothetical protein